MTRRFFQWLGMALLAALCLLPDFAAAAVGDDDAPDITAQSAVVIEATTGRVVFGKNAEERRYPASMTKMMTCILALEQAGMRRLATISPNAAQTEDSPLGLQPAEQLEMGELLLGMMLHSDNGAAVAVAENLAGTVPLFSERMNEKARELGCTDTNFANPNGLPNPAHYSTARDMARIAAYCMKNADFRALVGQKEAIMRWAYPKGKYLALENTNELLGRYDGIEGIKTGWTNAAGGCLAAAAKRNGVELIAIVMHADGTAARFTDAQKLLNYGFRHVRMQRAIAKERVQKAVWVKEGTDYRVPVTPDEDVNFALLHGEKPEGYKVRYELPRLVEAPVKRGQLMGYLVEQYQGKEVARIPLRARADVPQGFSFLSKFLVGALALFL